MFEQDPRTLHSQLEGKSLLTLSFSDALIAALEQERAKACELNNLRLYNIAQGLLGVGEGKALGEVARLLGVSAKTVWNWLKRLRGQGLGGWGSTIGGAKRSSVGLKSKHCMNWGSPVRQRRGLTAGWGPRRWWWN
jgi:hypothetical protein